MFEDYEQSLSLFKFSKFEYHQGDILGSGTYSVVFRGIDISTGNYVFN